MLKLLGPVSKAQTRIAGAALPPKALFARAFIDLSASSIVTREAIYNLLWENASQVRAAGNLRQMLAVVRQWEEASGERLFVVDRDTIKIDDNCVQTDLRALLQLRGSQIQDEPESLAAFADEILLEGIKADGIELEQWLTRQRASVQSRFRMMAQSLAMVRPVVKSSDAVLRFLDLFSRDGGPASLAALALESASAEKNQVRSSLPRLVILPPVVSKVDESSRLATALIEDVTLSLCRMRSFAIFAPYTARQIGGQDPIEAVAPLNVEYVCAAQLRDGRENQSAARLAVRLINTKTRQIIFAEEFNLDAQLLSEGYTCLADTIARMLATGIERLELSTFRRTGAASAYSLFLLARDMLQTYRLDTIRKARARLERALELSPGFTPAISLLARSLHQEWLLASSADTALLKEAGNVARSAIALDPQESAGYRELGQVLLYLKDVDGSLAHYSLARDRAPHHADLLADEADAWVHNSEPDLAICRIDEAIALNPFSPDEYLWIKGSAEFQSENYAASLATLRKMKDTRNVTRLMAGAAAMLGDKPTAEFYKRQFYAAYPNFRLKDWPALVPFKNKAHVRQFVHAFRLAGFT